MGEKDVYVDVGSRHSGTVSLKKSALKVKDQKIMGGDIIINLDTIKVTDLKSPKWAAKLTGHLKSDDFFDTKNHPEAVFTISKVEFIKEKLYMVSGMLKIRGVEKKKSFKAKIEKNNKQLTASGKMTINRLDFGVKYNSKKDFLAKVISIPKDKVIKDEFELDFNLVAKAP